MMLKLAQEENQRIDGPPEEQRGLFSPNACSLKRRPIACVALNADSSAREFVIERISKRFRDHVVLNDIKFDVCAGEMLAIIGESGCGKSVLLDIITGIVWPESGRIMVVDHNRPDSPLLEMLGLDEDDRDGMRRHWGEVFQRNALFSGTVHENIALWFRAHTDLSESEVRKRVRESLAAVNLDVDYVIDKPRESLSGGMAKRVAIARAISIDPVVIFYDEPTSGLDPVTSAGIQELIWNIHHRPHSDGRVRTSIIMTHDKELLRRLVPRVLMLHNAGVQFDGSFDDFEHSSDPATRRYLALMPVLHADMTRLGPTANYERLERGAGLRPDRATPLPPFQ